MQRRPPPLARIFDQLANDVIDRLQPAIAPRRKTMARSRSSFELTNVELVREAFVEALEGVGSRGGRVGDP
jgi:hypothetical protein